MVVGQFPFPQGTAMLKRGGHEAPQENTPVSTTPNITALEMEGKAYGYDSVYSSGVR